ncbi:transcriptional regulator, partial [Stenotrophomonas geniculata]
PYMQPRGRDGQPLQPAATRVRKLKDDGRDT